MNFVRSFASFAAIYYGTHHRLHEVEVEGECLIAPLPAKPLVPPATEPASKHLEDVSFVFTPPLPLSAAPKLGVNPAEIIAPPPTTVNVEDQIDTNTPRAVTVFAFDPRTMCPLEPPRLFANPTEIDIFFEQVTEFITRLGKEMEEQREHSRQEAKIRRAEIDALFEQVTEFITMEIVCAFAYCICVLIANRFVMKSLDRLFRSSDSSPPRAAAATINHVETCEMGTMTDDVVIKSPTESCDASTETTDVKMKDKNVATDFKTKTKHAYVMTAALDKHDMCCGPDEETLESHALEVDVDAEVTMDDDTRTPRITYLPPAVEEESLRKDYLIRKFISN